MKRILAVILLLALPFNISVSAASNSTERIYTDADSGVMFTIPSNWERKAFTEEREYIDVKFVSTKDESCAIIYGSTDMWDKLPASDRVGYNRSDINNSTFTKSEIAEIFKTTAGNITTVTYNGVQYFKGVTYYELDSYGVEATATITQLMYIDNGWMYMFQFSGTSNQLYSDFESLLKSVEYPTDSDGIGSANNNSGVVAVVVLLVIVAIIVIAIVVSRKKNTVSETPTYCAPIYNTPTSESASSVGPVRYCVNCGQALPLDSEFCHKCGTKIEKRI